LTDYIVLCCLEVERLSAGVGCKSFSRTEHHIRENWAFMDSRHYFTK